jgi:three-Cys-motif partner protein
MEDFYRDNEGLIYDRVKWHTRKKHAFIKSYLNIWVENVKRSPPTLDIFDLFASTGLCYCDDSAKYKLGEPTWSGSAILAAECLEHYSNGQKLFLNTFHPKNAICQAQKANLERLLRKYSRVKPIITTVPIDDAVDEARTHLSPTYPSIWILDPYKSSDLPWELVEKIGKFRGQYQTKSGQVKIRKPEMIINLMTYGLQMNIDINPHVVSHALGMEETEWRPKYDVLMKKYDNTRKALIDLYAEKLTRLYEKPPIVIEVNTTEEAAIVYCLFLCTDSDAGHYLMKLKGLDDYKTWEYGWKTDAKRISAEKKIPEGQSRLFDNF